MRYDHHPAPSVAHHHILLNIYSMDSMVSSRCRQQVSLAKSITLTTLSTGELCSEIHLWLYYVEMSAVKNDALIHSPMQSHLTTCLCIVIYLTGLSRQRELALIVINVW